ncbi:MAG: 50S ribosomal protein L21 [Clostridia bacterium]|nr:50S ribosomal protein L21 [Clostridia bacterium]
MYAIIQTGGKQYMVSNGDTIYIEKLNAEAEEIVKFDKVVAFSDGENLSVGTPYLDVEVEGKVIKNGKQKKITVFTYKPKKNEKRKMGHRQPYTKVQIVNINGEKFEAATEE